jgi:hypothetical protein
MSAKTTSRGCVDRSRRPTEALLRKSRVWNLPTRVEAGLGQDKQINKQAVQTLSTRSPKKKWYFFVAVAHDNDSNLMLCAGYRYSEAPRQKGCQDGSCVRGSIPFTPRQGKQIALLVYTASTQG